MLDSLATCNQMSLQISTLRKRCVKCAATKRFEEGVHVVDVTNVTAVK